MSDITLEKVDQVIERSYVTYKEAKEALEASQGDVLEALIYIENERKREYEEQLEEENLKFSEKAETINEFKAWLSQTIKKGNVSRVKIKKEDKILVDVPVNASIAAGVIAILLPPVLAVGVVTCVATDLVIEITKTDGTVEVINKIVKDTAINIKDKAQKAAGTAKEVLQDKSFEVKEKISDIKEEGITNPFRKHEEDIKGSFESEAEYTYTVTFDEL